MISKLNNPNKYYKDITIIIVTYKSNNKVINFITKIPKIFKIIIVDNSDDILLKKKFKKNKNIIIYFKKNNGFGTALNFAVSRLKTNYFFQVSPDLEFDFKQLKFFYEAAVKLNDKFSALGPRFINADKKGHIQSNEKEKIGNVEAVHGSAMFINKKIFNKIGGIDENIFLYFEENDYCLRGKKINYRAYQINKTFIKKKGQSVEFTSVKEKKALEMLLIWHFIWSKFYYYKKRFGQITSLIIFIPLMIRTNIKIIINRLVNNKEKIEKYTTRLDGLMTSIKGKKSSLRP